MHKTTTKESVSWVWQQVRTPDFCNTASYKLNKFKKLFHIFTGSLDCAYGSLLITITTVKTCI